MILNLDPEFEFTDAYWRNEKVLKFKSLTFSGGEPHIVIDLPQINYLPDTESLITTRICSFNDLGLLCIAVNAFRQNYGNESALCLVLPYFPAARQDRVTEDGAPLTVKVYADIINSLNFDEVLIFDPHSDVTPALINNCTVVDNVKYVLRCLDEILTPEELAAGDYYLVSPDAGARKKVQKVADAIFDKVGLYPTIVQCTKERNLTTGHLSNFTVHKEGGLGWKKCIVIDDILDGGATFEEVSHALGEKSAGELYLIISHGIFSKGYGHLKNFNTIFTTDSFKTLPAEEQFSEIRRTFGPSWVPKNVRQIKLNALFL